MLQYKFVRGIKHNIKSHMKYLKLFQKYKMDKLYGSGSDKRYLYLERDKTKQIGILLNKVEITLYPNAYFQHWIDEKLILVNIDSLIGNMPPNYKLIIDASIEYLINENSSSDLISVQNKKLLLYVKSYIERVIDKLKSEQQTENIMRAISSFEGMLERKANSLEDALQRILFWSSIFWQTGHSLVGLGRLDKILDRFANEKDYEETVCVLIEFIVELHRYYNYKSASIKGDIGQIIILGGKESDGTYFSNNLTYEFIEAIKRAGVPDPKCLLRVSEVMPQELLKNAVDCIATGIGSPLLSNDDVVVPALIEFGYDIEDAYNYVTSACWEPVSYGNSLEQNNLGNIKFADAFVEMLKDDKIVECKEYKELFEIYLIHLEKEINNLKENISLIEWENEPLYTLFTEGCKDNDKDLSQGGAKYNDYGVLSIGLANTVNSLINIEKLVFEDKKWSISEVHKAWIDNNVEVMSQISIDSASMKKTFGHDSSASIEIVNRIIDFTKGEFSNYKNKFGGRVKFGLSSPAYINGAVSTGYTVDGRKAGEPVSVHISSDDSVAYTELISFASKLHYNGCSSNGNVVDFFVTPSFINDNKEKFVQFVYLGIKSGFFQTQMNVVGSETLIAAKNNPEAYKNLIVRVWGFSAYFNDLPEDYKEVLIKRALINEGFDYDNNKYTKIFVT